MFKSLLLTLFKKAVRNEPNSLIYRLIKKMQKEITNIEDQLLVMDAQDGSLKAMELLVERWQKRLWNYALRLTGNRQASWDVTQQSWLSIIKSIRKLHDPAKFKPWAYKITTNKAINWIKKNKYRTAVPLVEIQHFCNENPHNTDLKDSISMLDMKKRTVINLYYFEQLNISEISISLRIPAGTVKSRLNSARQELKLILQKENK